MSRPVTRCPAHGNHPPRPLARGPFGRAAQRRRRAVRPGRGRGGGSFTAQYRMVDATRHLPVVAALEAAIPDAAALVFACLGIAWPCTAAARFAPGR